MKTLQSLGGTKPFFDRLRRRAPKWVAFAHRLLKNPDDLFSCLSLVASGPANWTMARRLAFVRQVLRVSYHVDCAHTEREIFTFVRLVAALPEDVTGCIVEAGCYKGGGTAKLSVLASLTGRRLKVFDSFRGMPPNEEDHGREIFGTPVNFPLGAYAGSLALVKAHVAKFGCLEVCDFVEGWFEDTLPHLSEPVAAAYLDVDLVASTQTCLKYLFPRLRDGGVLASQDGHLPLVMDVFRDDQFWRDEVGHLPPHINDIGQQKLITMRKDASRRTGITSA